MQLKITLARSQIVCQTACTCTPTLIENTCRLLHFAHKPKISTISTDSFLLGQDKEPFGPKNFPPTLTICATVGHDIYLNIHPLIYDRAIGGEFYFHPCSRRSTPRPRWTAAAWAVGPSSGPRRPLTLPPPDQRQSRRRLCPWTDSVRGRWTGWRSGRRCGPRASVSWRPRRAPAWKTTASAWGPGVGRSRSAGRSLA